MINISPLFPDLGLIRMEPMCRTINVERGGVSQPEGGKIFFSSDGDWNDLKMKILMETFL